MNIDKLNKVLNKKFNEMLGLPFEPYTEEDRDVFNAYLEFLEATKYLENKEDK